MNIHEYQAKEILKNFGVPVANGEIVSSKENIREIASKVSDKLWVVKAQIHAGGRGKGGGVKIAKSLDEVEALFDEMMGMQLITHQTGPEGKKVRKLYIEEGSSIADELYLSILVDRQTSKVSFIVSTEGGVNIEEVAEKTPDKITTVPIDPGTGVTDEDVNTLSQALKLNENLYDQAFDLFKNLYNAFTETDMSLLEINPLVYTDDNNIICLDAKVNFDDNALFRHPDLKELIDPFEEDESELKASELGFSYIKLDGNIGCLVNGAGLAMATMDIIKLYGAEPANFLDVGGSATKDLVTEAFKIILSDKNVEGILVNIFGGIMRCDVVAEGIIGAAKEVNISVPLVVRLEGTNVDLGKKIIEDSDLSIISASDLDDAAIKITEAI
ncbi:MAG: ADP-forming succinate--CoA ligase subunit beta [Pseudomonadota bacterium]|nr:ADP-forming succinate--CoA ligase subunit beta [Pseudomonadota bacterium]MEC9392741.1 ADP-forming succinate--CoA ligase subunit beta [Pseudomonadota bacterium]MED5437275.1 ADP-forming succinate--CoA ligase subunit beta [Pseudomonadota bacterium]